MADVFVSYKAEDRARVRPLVEALIAEGFGVWWDVQIAGGEVWRGAIARELEAAACVIVVWSEGSIGPAGHFVQDEASQAQRRGVLLPVAIDPVSPPLGFGQHQALSLTGWRGSRRDPRFADVLAAVRAIVGGGPRLAQGVPATARRRLSPRIAAGAAALLALVVGVLSGVPPKFCRAAGLNCGSLAAAAPKFSLAVLPFENLSGDPSQAYFSDGLTEELIGTLARLKPLSVIARTSSFQFRGSRDSPQAVAAKLGVAYLLDGSVRRQGSVVRVSASLADATTGLERWSETYDREVKDIFAVQSGIAQAVAEALRVRLLGGDIAALSGGETVSPEAYDSYLRGRQLILQAASEAGYREAIGDFENAIAADPRYAKAYAGKANALMSLASRYLPANEVGNAYERAYAAAVEGANLAPSLPSTQVVLATSLIFARHDFRRAAAAFGHARQSGAGDAGILAGYGLFLCETGDCFAGAAAMNRSAALDPLNPTVFFQLGTVLLAGRQYNPAILAFRQALYLSPKMGLAHAQIATALILSGRSQEALGELAIEPVSWARLAGQAIAARATGDVAAARRALSGLIADGDANAYQEAQVYAQWGDRDSAFRALEKAMALKDSGLLMLKVDPLLDRLRSDPRVGPLMNAMGLGMRE